MNDKIETLIQTFSTTLRQAIREDLQGELQAVLGAAWGGKSGAKGVKLLIAKAKRTPTDLEDVKSRIVATLKEEPDLRNEDLQKRLKMEGADLQLPLRQLVEEKVLKFKGVARGRTYRVG